MTDIWAKKPDPSDDKYWDWKDVNEKYGVADNFHFKEFIEDRDAWLKKLKAHYEPYDELLKAEPLMPLDIKSVLAKEGMPILIDEGRFRELKGKAEKYDELIKTSAVANLERLTEKLGAIKEILEAEA